MHRVFSDSALGDETSTFDGNKDEICCSMAYCLKKNKSKTYLRYPLEGTVQAAIPVMLGHVYSSIGYL